jgi:hypothetical protein
MPSYARRFSFAPLLQILVSSFATGRMHNSIYGSAGLEYLNSYPPSPIEHGITSQHQIMPSRHAMPATALWNLIDGLATWLWSLPLVLKG